MLFLAGILRLILKGNGRTSAKRRLARLIKDFALRNDFELHDLNM